MFLSCSAIQLGDKKTQQKIRVYSFGAILSERSVLWLDLSSVIPNSPLPGGVSPLVASWHFSHVSPPSGHKWRMQRQRFSGGNFG